MTSTPVTKALPSPLPQPRSKTVATWLAALVGTFGLHRLYLYGRHDTLAWLHPWPTLIGLYGVQRARSLGQDDMLAWLLIPLLGLMIAATMLTAIVWGLRSDEDWNARHNPGRTMRASGWGAILGVIFALVIGAAALMATIAFSGQRFFEYQQQRADQGNSSKLTQ